MTEATARFHKDMVIGEVLDAHPGAKEIIEWHFGSGCFTCPGMRVESISFGATMHNLDPELILKDLNELP